jgi:hypothetical protein
MKKIQITGGVCCNPFWLSALIGDVIEIDAKIADKVVAAGRGEYVEQPEVETAMVETAKVETATKGKGKAKKDVIPTDSEGAE